MHAFDLIGTHLDKHHPPVGTARVASRASTGAQTFTAREYVLKGKDYLVRLADSSTYRKLNKLVERMYAWRGYRTETQAELAPPPHRIALVASRGEQLFGTLTLGLDGKEGLLADELYRQEINTFRGGERKVCELSKLAVDPEHSSKELLAALFHLAYVYGRIVHGATDAFIEVNPRHAGYYKRLLGFRQIGERRSCPRVDAPAVLLHLELAKLGARIPGLGGASLMAAKSPHPCFMSVRA